MDAVYEMAQGNHMGEYEPAHDLNAWFLVSGDTDDFIFYGEPDNPHSEK